MSTLGWNILAGIGCAAMLFVPQLSDAVAPIAGALLCVIVSMLSFHAGQEAGKEIADRWPLTR